MPVRWWPRTPIWENYTQVFDQAPFLRYLLNSLFVGASVTLLNLLTCSMAGFSFAKYHYWGRDYLFIFVLATLMVPLSVIYVPLFILVKGFGWINTYAGLILPAATGAFGIFLMRQNIVQIPDSLLDAARIDGASEWSLYWRIVLPLARPALAALSIFVFLNNWDSLLWPLLVVNHEDLKTLPLGLSTFVSAYGTNYPVLMAASTMAIAPIIGGFIILQRHFVNAWMFSGLKD